MANRVRTLVLTTDQRAELTRTVRARGCSSRVVERARIVLLAADGVPGLEIAGRVGCSEPTVIRWRSRFADHGLAGLVDASRASTPMTISQALRDEILAITFTEPPAHLGFPHWSSRLLAARLPVSHATVARVWKHVGIQRAGSGAFQFATDPVLEARAHAIIGLFLDPPNTAVALCADVRPSIEASDHVGLPRSLHLRLAGSGAADYCPRGAAALYAELEIATGAASSTAHHRRSHMAFLGFLKQVAAVCPRRAVQVVAESCATYRHPAVKAWLAANPRISMHVTATPGSWINLVEVFARIQAHQAMLCGTLARVAALEGAVSAYIGSWDGRREPFRWVRTADATRINGALARIENTYVGPETSH